MSRRFRAPTNNGDTLADPPFAAVGELAARNRELLGAATVEIDGTPLRDFRDAARREVLFLAPFPHTDCWEAQSIFATGHQPELFHPGVWLKNFVLNRLARQFGAVPLNLIVDNDTMKSAHILAPVWDADPRKVRIEKRPFDDFAGEVPWELGVLRDAEVWERFWLAAPKWRSERIRLAWSFSVLDYSVRVEEIFSSLRQETERRWGCENVELRVSEISQSTAFRRFARHITANLPRFRTAYNRAVAGYRREHGIKSKSHPVPDLAENELPFWEFTDTGRVRATAVTPPERLRPRALTLTLFVRLCLAEWFIHGIGGAKYDEVTDAVIRDFFGVEPPAFQVVTGTLHLPLPGFPRVAKDVAELDSKLRRLRWNPEYFLPNDHPLRLEKWLLTAEKPNGRPAVRQWFARIRELTDQMRAAVAEQVADTEREIASARAEAEANAILKRRDYSWTLYPEDVLKAFLTGVSPPSGASTPGRP